MGKVFLLAFVVLGIAASPAAAQKPAPLQPGVDTAQERQALRKLSFCLAQTRQNWARRTLDQPYLSEAQASAASEALTGNDNCAQTSSREFAFRTSGLVGALAEHFVARPVTSLDPANLGGRIASVSARNVTEDFALCVASHDVNAARAMVLSDPGSAAETAAANRIADHVAPCTNRGEQLTVDLQSLRSLMAIALYRAVTGSNAGK